MKILKLEFENINSLKGKHSVDFQQSPFTNSTLFAITGPTGSGKSTLLDVICLALFNRVPRLGNMPPSKNQIGKTGAIITRNQKTAMAAVTYEGKNGVYCSEWNIHTSSEGNLQNHKMNLTKVETNELIDLKNKEVPAENQKNIGLNYTQFVKSVMLAQGEFSQFLKAKEEERGELLEKITGTGMYRQLGQRSYEKFKEENKEIEKQQGRIATVKELLLDEAQEKSISEDFAAKNKALAEQEKAIKTLEKQLEVKKQIAAQQKVIQEKQNEKNLAEKSLTEFNEEHGFPLNQHEKAEAEAEKLRKWNRLQSEKKEREIERKDLQDKSEKNGAEIYKSKEQIETLIGKQVEKEQLLVELQSFGEEIRLLQEAQREKRNEYSFKKDQLNRELEDINITWHPDSLEKDQKILQELAKASVEKIKILEADLEDLNQANLSEEKERLTEQLESIREAIQQEKEIDKKKKELKKCKDELTEITPKSEKIPSEIETAQEKIKFYQERGDKLILQKENQLLKASLKEHRHKLKEGESCPLCGATEHPFAQYLPEQDHSVAAEITKNQQTLRTLNTSLSDAKALFKNLGEQTTKLQQQNAALQESLAAENKTFELRFKTFYQNGQKPNWEILNQHYQKQLKAIDAYEKENRQAKSLAKSAPLMKALQEVLSEGKKLQTTLKEHYQGEDINQDVAKLSTQWTHLQAAQVNISEQQKRLKQKIAVNIRLVDQLENKLNPFVKTQGFETIAQAREALMPEAECKNLRDQRNLIQDNIKATKSALKILSEQLQTWQKKEVEADADILTAKLIKGQKQRNTLAEETKELSRLLKNQVENQQKLTELKSEIAEKQKHIRKWQLLKELIGDATGKKFNDFAQDLNLKHLIHLANKRLKSMSDRYLIDQAQENEDDGLTAIDQEMGRQRRSVKTLSGGETFILSLSLALALSDLASKNVVIKSLFIDEGFGTLDQETLDQTLDTLERLQAESSKTIGIISHVESLKERIATQIQLTRNGQGYSSLEVVPQRQN